MIKVENVFFDSQFNAMHFNINIPKQQKVAIIGTSGAGKSTFLNLLSGFIYPKSGKIILDSTDHTYTEPHQRPISILFQESNLFDHLTVKQNIALGIKPSLTLSQQEMQAILEAANITGLTKLLPRFPPELSGGEKQRVGLARCLLRNQPILLLDEPFSALNIQLRSEMLMLIEQLCTSKQLTLLIVTHQIPEVSNHVDRIITIENGKMIEN